MIADDNSQNAAALQSGAASPPEMVRVPDWRWLLKWVALTTAAMPVALLLSLPIAAILIPVLNLGVDAGIMPGYDRGILSLLGFFVSFAFMLAAAQWLLLRNYLPNGRGWLLATGTGWLTGGILIGVGFSALSNVEMTLGWAMAVYLLLAGCALGIAQWLVLRRIIPNAFWIVVIDIAAACSLVLIPRPITNLPGLLATLLVLTLPAWITGIGVWFLIKRSQPEESTFNQDAPIEFEKRPLPKAWIGLGLVALIPAFFLLIWIYAASQLALAKNEGVYPTVEEAVIERNSQGWGGAEVVRLEDVRASVNQHDGSQPHVWFGGARVYLDRVPDGWNRTEYSSGSYYLRVKDGWVHVPEGAFPEFIGWVMDLYDMEGVDEWIAENG